MHTRWELKKKLPTTVNNNRRSSTKFQKKSKPINNAMHLRIKQHRKHLQSIFVRMQVWFSMIPAIMNAISSKSYNIVHFYVVFNQYLLTKAKCNSNHHTLISYQMRSECVCTLHCVCLFIAIILFLFLVFFLPNILWVIICLRKQLKLHMIWVPRGHWLCSNWITVGIWTFSNEKSGEFA